MSASTSTEPAVAATTSEQEMAADRRRITARDGIARQRGLHPSVGSSALEESWWGRSHPESMGASSTDVKGKKDTCQKANNLPPKFSKNTQKATSVNQKMNQKSRPEEHLDASKTGSDEKSSSEAKVLGRSTHAKTKKERKMISEFTQKRLENRMRLALGFQMPLACFLKPETVRQSSPEGSKKHVRLKNL